MKQLIVLQLLITLFVTGCATSPMGRKQFILIGDDQMNQMGVASFQKMKTSTKISNNKYIKAIFYRNNKRRSEKIKTTFHIIIVNVSVS